MGTAGNGKIKGVGKRKKDENRGKRMENKRRFASKGKGKNKTGNVLRHFLESGTGIPVQPAE